MAAKLTDVTIRGIHVSNIEKVEVVERENTENFTQKAVNGVVNGMISGVIGQMSLQTGVEMPMTKTMAARFSGGVEFKGIDLTAKKTQAVVSSCWGPSFNHPMDFHYHLPEHPGQRPSTVMC